MKAADRLAQLATGPARAKARVRFGPNYTGEHVNGCALALYLDELEERIMKKIEGLEIAYVCEDPLPMPPLTITWGCERCGESPGRCACFEGFK